LLTKNYGLPPPLFDTRPSPEKSRLKTKQWIGGWHLSTCTTSLQATADHRMHGQFFSAWRR